MSRDRRDRALAIAQCAVMALTLAAAILPARMVSALAPPTAIAFGLAGRARRYGIGGGDPGWALAFGWTVAHGSSPYTAAALIAGKVAGTAPETVGWKWNGLLSLALAAFGIMVIISMAMLDFR